MKVKFDIKYQADIEAGKVKVVTADDRPVTIIRWNMKGNYPILACTMVRVGDYMGEEFWDEERPFAYDKEGHAAGTAPADKMDLFILNDELRTEFEKELDTMLEYALKHAKPGVDVTRIFKDRILDLARMELEAELPRWKKCAVHPSHPGVLSVHVGCHERNGYEIDMDEVFDKLPKDD